MRDKAHKFNLEIKYITGALDIYLDVYDFQSTDYGYRFKLTNPKLKGTFSIKELTYDWIESIRIFYDN